MAEEDDNGDPPQFSKLISYCKPTASASEKLLLCPFTQHDYDDDDHLGSAGGGSPSQPPGIVMISVSDSDSTWHEIEKLEFTPSPENSPEAVSGDRKKAPEIGSSRRDKDLAVDLEMEKPEITPSPEAVAGGRKKSPAIGRSGRGSDLVVDLEDDSDIIRFTKKIRVTEVENLNRDTLEVVDTEVIDIESEEDVELNKSKNEGNVEGNVELNNSKNEGNVELNNSKKEGNVAASIGVEMSDKARGKRPMKVRFADDDDEGGLERDKELNNESSKETMRETNVGGGNVVEKRRLPMSMMGKRQLPSTFTGGDEYARLQRFVRRKLETGDFGDLLEAWDMVYGVKNDAGKKPDDAGKRPVDGKKPDFFEIAMQRGMTFARPKWWPPEGFP